jgi:hypothetical protein
MSAILGVNREASGSGGRDDEIKAEPGLADFEACNPDFAALLVTFA